MSELIDGSPFQIKTNVKMSRGAKWNTVIIVSIPLYTVWIGTD